MLMYLMQNPEKEQSIEFNDNRLSLYAAQKGRCAVIVIHLGLCSSH